MLMSIQVLCSAKSSLKIGKETGVWKLTKKQGTIKKEHFGFS